MDQAVGLRGLMKESHKDIHPAGVAGKHQSAPEDNHRSIRIISITSGKGGVGKTSLTVNLALALRYMKKRVLILDADLGLANMDVMLGLSPKYTISHVFRGEKRLEEVIISAPGGIKLLPAASGIQELTDLDSSQRLLLLNELDMIHHMFDVLLIDTGAGISSNVMYFNYAAMEKVVIVTNEPTSLTDAYALIKVLTNKYQQKRFKVLVNAVRNAAEADRIFRNLALVADKYLGSPSLDYLGWIPYDRTVPAAIRKQQILLQVNPDTPAGKGILNLARTLMSDRHQSNFEGDIKFFWQRLLEQ